MTLRWIACAGSLFGLFVWSTSAAAQEAPPEPAPKIDLSTPAPAPVVPRTYHVHDGFYLRASIGLGALSLKYDPDPVETSASGGALAFDLMIGGSPSPGLAIGGALIGDVGRSLTLESGGRELGDVNAVTSLVGPFIDGFPDAKGGWHLGGMLGFAAQQVDAPGSDAQTTNGVGGAAWGGFDAWVGDEWSVGGLGRIGAAVTRGKDGDQDINASSLSFVLMFTALYH
jgi:hypothetical protein